MLLASSTRLLNRIISRNINISTQWIRQISTVSEEVKPAYGYCAHLVKQSDYESYLWISQLPKEIRPPLLAIRAFNVETANIASQIKSKDAGVASVRFEWWRTCISSVFRQNPPKHPVAIALAHSLLDHGLQRYPFKRIIDARERDALDTQPPLTMDDLEKYAEDTATQTIYLQLSAVGVKNRDADHAASHLGRACGLVSLLRGSSHHSASRRCYIPVELLAENGVSQDEVYTGVSTEGIKNAALKVASRALGHLDECRRVHDKVPKEATPMLLHAVFCEHYLEALEKADFDIFDPKVASNPVHPIKRTLALKYHLLKGTY